MNSEASTVSTWASNAEVGPILRRILVVDDSRAQRRVLTSILRRNGWDVLEADSGLTALGLVANNSVDIILSDWMMPGMSGPEFCEAFRSLGKDRYAYFILLTSKSDREDVAEGLERGADDFLAKPVDISELKARLKAGERILSMQEALQQKNLELSQTLTRLNLAQEAIERDLDEARRLQQSLVPERYRDVVGGSVSLLLHPSGAVGGDLVGSFRVSETRLGLFAIDVAGHGIASALMTARLAGYLTSTSPDQNVAMTIDDMGLYSMHPPSKVCAELNRLMLDDLTTDLYFTMLIAECDLRCGTVEICQAGHPKPLILRANGSTEFVGDGGLPIGLVPSAEYEAFGTQLRPGDRLLFYSDGITECEGRDGTQLGEKGLVDILVRGASTRGIDVLDSVVHDLAAFSARTDFGDDVSAALFEFNGVGA